MRLFRKLVSLLECLLPRPIFLLLYGIYANFFNICNLLFGYGQWRTSFTHTSIDAHGAPIPWFTYPAIEYLNGLDLSQMSVFEFGSGNSTRYWAQHVERVVAVEDNPVWAANVRHDCAENTTILIAESAATYSELMMKENDSFDIIVIDGTDRLGCARAIAGRLRAGGFVILDDADEHVEAAEVLRQYNLLEVDFAGFSPIISYTKTTTFFFDPQFRPKPRKKQMPPHSVCHPLA
jgi:hypothetical protein